MSRNYSQELTNTVNKLNDKNTIEQGLEEIDGLIKENWGFFGNFGKGKKIQAAFKAAIDKIETVKFNWESERPEKRRAVINAFDTAFSSNYLNGDIYRDGFSLGFTNYTKEDISSNQNLMNHWNKNKPGPLMRFWFAIINPLVGLITGRKIEIMDPTINNKDGNGYTPLANAILNDNAQETEKLLSASNINVNGFNDKSPLILALNKGKHDLANRMLTLQGFDLEDCLNNVYPETVKKLLNCEEFKKNVNKFFVKAIQKRSFSIANMLLNAGEINNLNELDEKGNNALMLAINYDPNNEQGIIDKLIKFADKDQVNKVNKAGYNALMLAISNKSPKEVIEKLLELPGTDFNIANEKKDNALTLAIRKGVDITIIENLIKVTDLKVVNSMGDNALMLAVFCNRPDVVKLLLKTDINVNLQNGGETAMSLALNKLKYNDNKDVAIEIINALVDDERVNLGIDYKGNVEKYKNNKLSDCDLSEHKVIKQDKNNSIHIEWSGTTLGQYREYRKSGLQKNVQHLKGLVNEDYNNNDFLRNSDDNEKNKPHVDLKANADNTKQVDNNNHHHK